ncbi:MAG: ABC transporter ATP-binding protein [Actinobacteria bacterium]|nr:ABC transporter ATP-binding protein [Actinomycetota bacterium]
MSKVHRAERRDTGTGASDGSDVVAVARTDLHLADGEFFVLIGPSGCGKSTLLRLIAGIEPPTTGDVLIDGVAVNDIDPRGRDVAMTFQSSALYPNLTVGENVGFSLRLAKVPRATIRERVREAAALVSIDHLLDRWPRQLSGGEGQRVAMARMLIRSPHLFLMDEPMSQLDAKLRTELRAEIVRLQRRVGVTTVYVTHDQVEAMSMGHRIAVMRRGRIVQCGAPDELYRHPADLFVGQFLGSPPMNAWRALAVADGDGVVLRWMHHELRLDADEVRRFGGTEALHGREVVIGVRPEALHLDATGPLTVSPRFTETLGPHQLLHCTLGAEAVRATDDGLVSADDHHAPIVVAAASSVSFDVWQPLHLGVDVDGIHLFDGEDGRSLEQSVGFGSGPRPTVSAHERRP